MQIDPALQTENDNYKLLTNLIVPRPIAWITSLNAKGIVNLAPFSFFNAVGSSHLYIVIGIGQRNNGDLKDTASNIQNSGEFVINMVTENLLAEMNISAIDFPSEESELIATHLNSLPSVHIKTPRLAEAEVSLECKLYREIGLGSSTLIIGEVLMFYVADRLIGPRFHINGFEPIGRLGSPSSYCRTTDRFELSRLTYAEWQKNNRKP